MPEPCIVVIGGSEQLAVLCNRAAGFKPGVELITFTHAEAVPALHAITARRPEMVVLERLFAATPRGAALINRIKADPALTHSEIRVLAHDSDYSRVVPRQPRKPVEGDLDQRGTRRALRFKIADKVDALVDRTRAAIVDLSTIGAQVVSPSPLKPNQRVRVALTDAVANVEFDATVAWTALHGQSGSRIRAGLEFVNADAASVNAFITRHKAPA